MAATPATIAAETAAAHQTEYEPVLPLTDIEVHPTNVRHDAIADEELVNSIAAMGVLEPVLVAPHPDTDGPYKWRLIAGHRRKDGSEKAGHTSVPAIIRYDLVDEGDQIAAMLVENGRRNGLTPIEEAEGFDLLADLGWDAEKIADTYGCSASTVRARRKLTSLKPTFQEQVAAGQVTLDEALLLASLPAKEQERLSRATPGSSFRYELGRSQDRVRREKEVAKQIKGFQQLGATEVPMPKGGYYWGLNDADHGLTRVESMPGALREPANHKGCLVWVNDGTAQYPSIKPLCNDISRHDDAIAAHQAELTAARSDEEKARDAENAARAAEQEAQREQRAAAEESRRVAARMRGDVVLEATRKVKIPPILAPLLRASLIDFFVDWPLDEQLYQVLADVPEDLRWISWNGKQAYLDTLPTMPPAQLWRCFVAGIVAHAEDAAESAVAYPAGLDDFPWHRVVLRAYLDELVTAGHQLTPPDEDLQRALSAPDEDES